ncbi:MAG: NADH-ubiquinone/plastoquinone oxidoreductase chain 6, partial [Dehalococcoidia bacterium]|nr:NADH-ubiquinone/plastoquinone oxidoreductase chain 6 [Dehalococcoidia bacterium]
MSLSLVVFYVLGAVCLGGALGVVLSRNVVYAALLLLVSLMGVAGIFLLLLAEFLALVQVLIYGGAITIVVLFVIMLTRQQEFRAFRDNPQRPLAVVAGLAVFGLLVAAMV